MTPSTGINNTDVPMRLQGPQGPVEGHNEDQPLFGSGGPSFRKRCCICYANFCYTSNVSRIAIKCVGVFGSIAIATSGFYLGSQDPGNLGTLELLGGFAFSLASVVAIIALGVDAGETCCPTRNTPE